MPDRIVICGEETLTEFAETFKYGNLTTKEMIKEIKQGGSRCYGCDVVFKADPSEESIIVMDREGNCYPVQL